MLTFLNRDKVFELCKVSDKSVLDKYTKKVSLVQSQIVTIIVSLLILILTSVNIIALLFYLIMSYILYNRFKKENSIKMNVYLNDIKISTEFLICCAIVESYTYNEVGYVKSRDIENLIHESLSTSNVHHIPPTEEDIVNFVDDNKNVLSYIEYTSGLKIFINECMERDQFYRRLKTGNDTKEMKMLVSELVSNTIKKM